MSLMRPHQGDKLPAEGPQHTFETPHTLESYCTHAYTSLAVRLSCCHLDDGGWIGVAWPLLYPSHELEPT